MKFTGRRFSPEEPAPSGVEAADRALYALSAGDYAQDPPQDYNLADLVGDLCHLAQRNGFEIGEILAQGIWYYAASCLEQAGSCSADWQADLRDPSNCLRVEEVLRVCGVPVDFKDRIYHMLGPPREEPGA